MRFFKQTWWQKKFIKLIAESRIKTLDKKSEQGFHWKWKKKSFRKNVFFETLKFSLITEHRNFCLNPLLGVKKKSFVTFPYSVTFLTPFEVRKNFFHTNVFGLTLTMSFKNGNEKTLIKFWEFKNFFTRG